jgi:hypothetical protein
MKLLIEYQYFGCFISYLISLKYSNIEIELYENYQKASFRNRMMLASPLGPVALSIPVLGGRNARQLSRDVKIDHREAWQSQHLKTILNYYSRSPWFEFYRPELEELYQQKPTTLNEWNRLCMVWVLAKIQISAKIAETESYLQIIEKDDVLDWRNQILPKNYTTAFENLLQRPCPVYQQVYQERTGFLPNLSILDLLFCEGPNAKNLLVSAMI